MGEPRPVWDGLREAAGQLAQAARRPGIGGKREILYSLDNGLVSVSTAVQMIAQSLQEAGYGPEVCDPVSETALAIFRAATKAENATHAVGSLMNMTVGDLAASQRQAPDQAELNGGEGGALPAGGGGSDPYRVRGAAGHWGAPMVGREVCDPRTGQLIGRAEETRTLRYPGTPETDVLMVRHLHGDGQVRAYEKSEVTDHVVQGRPIPPRRR